jgi:hypothetical protein
MKVPPLRVLIREEEVRRFLGYGAADRPRAGIEEMLASVLEEARGLISPRGLFRLCTGEEAQGLELTACPAPLAVGLVTIGPRLETRVSELLREGSASRALLLDAAGSAAVEEAADALERLIRAHEGAEAGVSGTARRFSPGYGSWPLTAQRPLFALLAHREIEVSLLPSLLMVPRKSVSFALWMAGDAPSGSDAAGAATAATAAAVTAAADPCVICGLTSCRYRKETHASGAGPSSSEDTP